MPDDAGMTMEEHVAWHDRIGPIVTSLDDPALDGLDPILRPYVMLMPGGSLMVKHPWVNTMPVMVGQANMQLTWKLGMMREYLAPEQRNLSGYLFVVVERPWRMSTVERWWRRGKLSIEELRELLGEVWQDTELPSTNLDEIDFLFHEAGFTTDDPEGWEKLPRRLTLYRGGPRGGISWTLDKEKAEWFAQRFSQGHPLYRIRIAKSKALGYFVGRGESEVVLPGSVWERGSGDPTPIRSGILIPPTTKERP